MTGFLLDINVVSELTKKSPDPGVIAFLSEQDNLWLSPIVLHELEFGLQLLPQGSRRDGLRQTLSELIAEYEDQVLPVKCKEAEWAARLRAQAPSVRARAASGRCINRWDSQISQPVDRNAEYRGLRRTRCRCPQPLGNIVTDSTENEIERAALNWKGGVRSDPATDC